MKRILALLLAVLMICSLCACKKDNEQNNKNTTTVNITTPDEPEDNTIVTKDSVVTPLLYKVSNKEGNYIWLFGSIHVGDDYFYPLPDYVLDAYNNADALAVECDTKAFESDTSLQTEAILPLIYLDGTKINDHISEETYNLGVEAMTEYGIYSQIFDFYKPIMWYSLIETTMAANSGVDASLGIDNYFLNKAYDNDKEIVEIESVKFQYEMLANFSEDLQIMLLEQILYYYENAPEVFEEDMISLMEMWASGDEEGFEEYLSDDGNYKTYKEKLLYKEYNKAMITDRNISMADFAENALKEGKVMFICVGSAHVIGDGAMADLLAQRGYTVEIVK